MEVTSVYSQSTRKAEEGGQVWGKPRVNSEMMSDSGYSYSMSLECASGLVSPRTMEKGGHARKGENDLV